MHFSLVLAFTSVALTSVTPAAATLPYLEADASAGACGGSVGCFVSQGNIPTSPTNSSIAKADEGNTLGDGSYANAHALVSFGHIHDYSDAYRVSGSDAQSQAMGKIVDEFAAGGLTPGQQTLTFAITGSHSDVQEVYGNDSYAYFNWQVYDEITGVELNGGTWFSTDALPQATLVETFNLPAGHGYYLQEAFETDTYSSYGVVDIADYSNTVDTYIATPGGAAVIGASGHSYAAPLPVPEPGVWVMLGVGLGVICSLARRLHGNSVQA